MLADRLAHNQRRYHRDGTLEEATYDDQRQVLEHAEHSCEDSDTLDQ